MTTLELSSRGRRIGAHTWVSIVLVVVAVGLIGLGLLVGTPVDEEEYRISILSTRLHAQALLEGRWLFWTSALGFGMPHPLGQSFLLHPLMPLAALLRPDHWAQLFQVCHLGILLVGTAALARASGLSPLATGGAMASMMLATPVLNYALTDFWPSGLYGWSLAPGVLAAATVLRRRTLGQPTLWTAAVGLGALGGLMAVNGHPGYTLVYAVPFAVWVVAGGRQSWDRRHAWLAAVVVAAVVAAPTIVHLLTEARLFPAGLPRTNDGHPLGWTQLADLLWRPMPLARGGLFGATLARGARVAYMGPWIWIALAGLRQHLRAGERACAAAFLVSLLLMATPGLDAVKVLPATYLFRDPMLLFGVVLAASTVDRWIETGRRRLAMAATGLQILLLGISAWPFVARTFAPEPSPRAVTAFAQGGAAIDALRRTVPAGARILYTVEVERLMNEGTLVAEGLWRQSPAYHGLRVVNGTYKGVALDTLSPSLSVFYGSIQTTPHLQDTTAALAALDVSALVATARDEVPRELQLVAEIPTARAGTNLKVYLVPDPASGIRLRGSDRVPAPARAAGCPHEGLLCRDLAPWLAARMPEPLSVRARAGGLTIEMPPVDGPTTVILPEMYRPGWRVVGGGPGVTVQGVAGLLTLDVPAATGRIELIYRPTLRLVAIVGAIGALAACLAFLGVARWRRTG